MKKILLIDGNSLANRAFYALPFLTDPQGRASGAVFGFTNILCKIISEDKPDGIIVAFDHARKTFRNNIYAEYKGTRKETPPELRSQFPLIKDLLREMGILVIEEDGIEADDIIGTAAKSIEGEKIILSGDRDLLQLISPDTEVWLTIKGVTLLNKVNLSNLKLNFEISRPDQIIELKALMGDSSDNIPGVAGIGEKTALKLLNEYDNVENLYENLPNITGKLQEKLAAGKDMAFLSKTLATIKTDCDLKVDLNDNGYDFPFSQKVQESFKKFGFGSLLKRIDLFGNGLIIEEKSRKIIDSKNVIGEFLSSIKGEFALNLEKMEFSTTAGEIYQISQTFDMFSSKPSLDEFLLAIKGVLEDENITVLTANAKSDLHKLTALGIDYKGYFDLKLASYLVHAGEPTSPLPADCDEYFSSEILLKDKLKKSDLENLYYNLELPLCKVLFEMEKDGFKIDVNELKQIDADITEKLTQLTQEIYDEAGEQFNINSPKQVAHILFEKLGLVAFNNKKQSTGIEVLNELKYSHPIVEKLISYRKYQKMKSTYIDVYLRIASDSGDVIHTSFNQALTNTGRISSSDPNLQNIPTNDEEGKVLRKIFISKFEGGSLISADYNQIELRLLADMSGEEKLIDIYNRGEDIHTSTAAHIFGVAPEDVTQKQRREAKAVNFGIIYGISDYGLSQNIKVSRKSAKEYIDSYFARYPHVKIFSDANIEFARENGYIKTKFGRIRHIPEIKSSNYQVRTFGERVAMNMPLQGTASDIIKMSMLKVSDALKEQHLQSQLILQIHDELVIDVKKGEEEKVIKLLKENMQDWIKLRVPLPISINEGKNLMECK